MKKKLLEDNNLEVDDDLPAELDFDAIRIEAKRQGREYKGYFARKNVRLEPDVAEVFDSSEAVNEALRKVIQEKKQKITIKAGDKEFSFTWTILTNTMGNLRKAIVQQTANTRHAKSAKKAAKKKAQPASPRADASKAQRSGQENSARGKGR